MCYNDPKMADNDELREFMLILRRALVMIVRWIERRYKPTAEPNP
jgi:hypothetical protein